jgi:hypothetical protein
MLLIADVVACVVVVVNDDVVVVVVTVLSKIRVHSFDVTTLVLP